HGRVVRNRGVRQRRRPQPSPLFWHQVAPGVCPYMASAAIERQRSRERFEHAHRGIIWIGPGRRHAVRGCVSGAVLCFY
ncbi:unnamed protein product, partial [Symbiodinium microadriaticum]